ncbi:hypothetical protein ACP70R_018724 [Stipagrostis hirtigluma subsp. patula]
MSSSSAFLRSHKLDGDAPRPPLAVVANDGVLPTDVLRGILLRLPAKTLCRLRVVCRSWRSLTSDPVFAAAHSSRHPPQFAGFHVGRREVHVLDLSGDILRRIPRMLDVATGAVTADITSEHEVTPATAFSLPISVLGYVPSTGEYKVLRIGSYLDFSRQNRPWQYQTCDVITLGGSHGTRWRARSEPPVMVAKHPGHMVLVGGTAYFLVNEATINTEPDRIATFDLATEEWRPTTIRWPWTSLLVSNGQDIENSHRKYFRLVGLNDCLVTIHHNNHDCSTDLWFLVDMEKSLWTKRYSVRWEHYLDPREYIFPLMFLEDGRIVMWAEHARILFSYDPRTGKWIKLACGEDYLVVHKHHGSLLCSGL